MTLKQSAIRTVNSVLAAVTPNPWAGKAWGTDVYEGAKSLNLPKGSLDFVVIRMGGTTDRTIYLDPGFADKVQVVWDAGAVPMAYWVMNSKWYPNNEYTVNDVAKQTNDKHPILNAIQGALRAGSWWKKVGILFLDAELEGAGPVWDAVYAEDLRNRFADLRKTGGFPPDMLYGMYSRAAWINSRVNLQTLCENQPGTVIWTANYSSAYPGKHMPIADYKTKSLPLITQTPRWFGDNPAKPKEYKRFWQYHGTFDGAMYSTCPEILSDAKYADGTNKPAGLDLNVFEGTRAELFEMVKFKDPLIETPPPPPPDEEPEPNPDLAELLERVEIVEANQMDHEQRVKALETWRRS